MPERWNFVKNKAVHKTTGFVVEFTGEPETEEFQIYPKNFPAKTSAVEVSKLVREATELYLSERSKNQI